MCLSDFNLRVLSVLPWSPCGATLEVLASDICAPWTRIQTALETIGRYPGVTVARETLNMYYLRIGNPLHPDNPGKRHYWLEFSDGDVRKEVEALIGKYLEGEK